ncbi:MAG: J domain-containing protein [Myxococcales bacterium FL481]|nr:MAG: J domain-containing protein [Myxococcales bacterium FL481]
MCRRCDRLRARWTARSRRGHPSAGRTGASVADRTAGLRAEIDRLAAGLESLSYYAYLGVGEGADYVSLREAFYARAQLLHPDRYLHEEDRGLRDRVYAVFKRLTEAYGVLSDPQLRGQYHQATRAGEHRLSAARSRRRDADERRLNNPFARVYLQSARAKLEHGAVNEAWIDIELALSLEEAAPLRKLHSEIVKRAATGRT